MTDMEKKALLRHLRRHNVRELPTDVRTVRRGTTQFILIGLKDITVGIYAYDVGRGFLRRTQRMPSKPMMEDSYEG